MTFLSMVLQLRQQQVLCLFLHPQKNVWDEFMKNPEKEINAIRTPPYHGDQGFIGRICQDAERWQNILPGRIISYKANIATPKMIGFNPELYDGTGNGKLPDGVSIVCFHGSPRPGTQHCPGCLILV